MRQNLVSMESKKIVFGVVGHPASGKDAVSDYLALRGFFKISGGDILREEMKKIGIPLDRAHVHEFVVKMRKENGNGYPAQEEVNRIKNNNGNSVVIGMRNTEEIKILRNGVGYDFKLIAVNSPTEVRYERAKARGRIGDDISFEQFKEEEKKERSATSGSHEVDKVIEISDVLIDNDGTLEELHEKIDELL